MRQSLEMALEALEKIAMVNAMDYEYQQWAKEYLAAIKEALAQPEQEPVGYWMGKFSDGAATLYKVPQESFLGYTYQNIPVYAIPPQRKPLTDEEIGKIALESQWGFSPHDDTLRFARAIEATHGIKE